MGQPRDLNMSWDKINAMKNFDSMLNNYGAYKDIIKTPEELAALHEAQQNMSEEL